MWLRPCVHLTRQEPLTVAGGPASQQEANPIMAANGEVDRKFWEPAMARQGGLYFDYKGGKRAGQKAAPGGGFAAARFARTLRPRSAGGGSAPPPAAASLVGPASDGVYAPGAILYELLVGRPRFQGETALEILEQVRSREPVPPRRLRPRLPREWVWAVPFTRGQEMILVGAHACLPG
jgi:hypothetical protein